MGKGTSSMPSTTMGTKLGAKGSQGPPTSMMGTTAASGSITQMEGLDGSSMMQRGT